MLLCEVGWKHCEVAVKLFVTLVAKLLRCYVLLLCNLVGDPVSLLSSCYVTWVAVLSCVKLVVCQIAVLLC